MTQEGWNQYFVGHWNFPGEKQNKHLAMFPEELPRRLIKMFSFVGDTVVDPFLGSWTTSLAARNLKRNSIGYEINKDFLPIIKEKLGLERNTIFQDTILEIVRQEELKVDFKEKIKELPYIFKDPIKFDKKIDPKKLRFGSKIDNSYSARETYYTVKEIISPEISRLTNHSERSADRYITDYERIKLLKKRGFRSKEISFLVRRGQKVVNQYLKFE